MLLSCFKIMIKDTPVPVDKVVASVRIENTASRKLMLKCGFQENAGSYIDLTAIFVDEEVPRKSRCVWLIIICRGSNIGNIFNVGCLGMSLG